MHYPIPIRLDYYLSNAETWNAIFQTLSIQNTSIIYDLCPGWSPKIELALIKTAYAGSVYLIDSNAKALRLHKTFLKSFNTVFTSHYVPHDILSKMPLYIPKATYIIGNHILDDLLLQTYCPNAPSIDQLFVQPKLLSPIWKNIIKNTSLIEAVIHKFVAFLAISTATNGYCMLSQYIGYQEQLYSTIPKNFYQQLMEKVSIELQNNGFTPCQKRIRRGLTTIQTPYFSTHDLYCYQYIRFKQ